MQKRLAVLLIVSLVSSMFLFASKTDEELWELQNIAASFDSDEKNIIFNTYKKESGIASSVNAFFGAGIGSFVQGDMVGGVVGLVGDLASIGLILSGIQRTGPSKGSIKNNATAVGMVFLIAFKLFEVIRPITFASSYNKKLTNAIFGIGDLAILPALGNQVPGVALVGSVRF